MASHCLGASVTESGLSIYTLALSFLSRLLIEFLVCYSLLEGQSEYQLTEGGLRARLVVPRAEASYIIGPFKLVLAST